jgi:hypothetical protein
MKGALKEIWGVKREKKKSAEKEIKARVLGPNVEKPFEIRAILHFQAHFLPFPNFHYVFLL